MTKREMELVKLFCSGLTVEDMYPQEQIVEVVEETIVEKAPVVEYELRILDELKPMKQRIAEDFALFSVWYEEEHGEEPTLTDYYRERLRYIRQQG